MIRFDERFKQLMIEKDYSFDDFSREFEMENGYYLDCSNFTQPDMDLPPFNVVIDLCSFFGVSCNYLLGISSVREPGSIGNTYDQFVALAALIIDSDRYDDDFKREFFMGIRDRFGF